MGVNVNDYDCSGWATVNDLKCSDGRTIKYGAFIADEGKVVPLVWNHRHDNPENVLGHAMLYNKDRGVYAYLKFNETEPGQNAKQLVYNGDVSALSIFANQLKQNGSDVVHGNIREVSLVLAGANPGAYIDCIMEHNDEADGECAVLYTGETLELMHSDEDSNDNSTDQEEKKDMGDGKEKTVQDVYETLNEEQRKVVEFLVGQAVQDALDGKFDEDGEDDEMKHNLFYGEDNGEDVIMHAEAMDAIIKDGKRCGSLRESFLEHSAEYGIENIDWLQPEFRDYNGGDIPFIKNEPSGWAKVVTDGVHHTPFSKIKMMFADIRADEARAKGYAKKSKYKVEQVITLLKRQVTPTTVYKKQKFDRDDLVDIDDMAKVGWIKGEMRTMLDEELARAYIFGDGRTALDDDKISETNIIPVVSDSELFTIQKEVTVADGTTLPEAIIDAAVEVQDNYEGSGNITMFMDATKVTACMLLKDADKRRMYKDINELATAMNVDRICKVPSTILPAGVYGVALDLKDYNVGADKGGAINMFDDFDIDYNQQKYLIETRCSACLTKPFSAFVLKAEG